MGAIIEETTVYNSDEVYMVLEDNNCPIMKGVVVKEVVSLTEDKITQSDVSRWGKKQALEISKKRIFFRIKNGLKITKGMRREYNYLLICCKR